MSREIEADYIEDYHNGDKHCIHCDSFVVIDGKNYCKELEEEISGRGTCDYFKARD